MELHVDWDKCQGHGKCYLTAPKLFQPDDEDAWGRAAVLRQTIDEADTPTLDRARQSVSQCPEFAIELRASVAADRP
ncbi:MAG: ferredoxin [Haloechinothrix sp.]